MKAIGSCAMASDKDVSGKHGIDPIDILVHDLKSPFGNIKASTELLLHDKAKVEASDLKRSLQRILRQSEKGLNLIRETLAQHEHHHAPLAIQKIPLRPFLENCIQEQQEKAKEKNIRLKLNLEADTFIMANSMYFSQILDNLVENALKCSFEGGLVEIDCCETIVDAADSKLRGMVFHVKDNGRGIPRERLPFVFMERVQAVASDKRTGHGLGLAICKQFCELHGGTIWATSELGHGATFSFMIPCSCEEPRTGE